MSHPIRTDGSEPWATLAARMAEATDAGDRPTALAILAQVESAADVPPSEPTAPLVVLARRFARAHGALAHRRAAGRHQVPATPTSDEAPTGLAPTLCHA